MPQPQRYDYIIAGAGSAACALAARLREDPDISVCLVEAGGHGNSLFVRMPAGNGFIFGNPKFDWGYESTPQSGLDGRSIYYPRGKGVGGTSLLNGLVYVRGNALDFDRWRDQGISGLGYRDVQFSPAAKPRRPVSSSISTCYGRTARGESAWDPATPSIIRSSIPIFWRIGMTSRN